MKLEILYFGGCPHYQPALDAVHQVISDLRLDVEVESVEVPTQEEATRLRFLGSPTIRVNGVDIEPDTTGRKDFGMSCRLYGDTGTPSAELIAAALTQGDAR